MKKKYDGETKTWNGSVKHIKKTNWRDGWVHNRHPAMQCKGVIKQMERGMRLFELAIVMMVMCMYIWIGMHRKPKTQTTNCTMSKEHKEREDK
jgi:hypothetical protein